MPVIDTKETIEINGTAFTAIEGLNYSYDYVKAARAITDGRIDQLSTYREFILNDLFFILYFVMGIKAANHPFVVSKCQEVENGPQTMTLDVWARGHFKALDCNTLILTANRGWVKHIDLQPGLDMVFAPNGKQVKVIANTGLMEDADCYVVKTSDGAEIIAAGEHLWPVRQKHKRRVSGTTDKRYTDYTDHIVSTDKIMETPYRILPEVAPSLNIFRAKRYEKDTTTYSVPRRFVSVEKTSTRPVNCIQVEGRLYLAGKKLVPTHNSTIITVAETAQYHLKNPEHCTCIFSYKKPAAGKFLDSIRKTYENELMKACFPDLLFDNPESQSPSWSLENGITIKREGKSRPQKTIQSSGLVEGMVTGDHFDRLVWDDVETDDLAEQPDQLRKCGEKFDMSQNLGMVGGTTLKRAIGTFYSHTGVVAKIRDKKDINGKNLFESRIVPATHDGTPNGNPVLLTQKELDEKKTESSYNSQQLCDPTPTGAKKLDGALLRDIEPENIPSDSIHKLMLIDPAGDSKDGRGDSWGIMVVGIEPGLDDIGASNIYITDLSLTPLSEAEAIEEITRMYLRNGVILQVGVEKVGISTTEIHVANALKMHRRRISLEDKTLFLLRPAGRNKNKRIESALAWPLVNGKIHMSTDIPKAYRDKLREELDDFPYGAHDDGIDVLSYAYDMIHDKDNKYRLLSSAPKRKRHLSVVPKHKKGGQGWLGA